MELKFKREPHRKGDIGTKLEGGEGRKWGERIPGRERSQHALLGVCQRFKVKPHWIENSCLFLFIKEIGNAAEGY